MRVNLAKEQFYFERSMEFERQMGLTDGWAGEAVGWRPVAASAYNVPKAPRGGAERPRRAGDAMFEGFEAWVPAIAAVFFSLFLPYVVQLVKRGGWCKERRYLDDSRGHIAGRWRFHRLHQRSADTGDVRALGGRRGGRSSGGLQPVQGDWRYRRMARQVLSLHKRRQGGSCPSAARPRTLASRAKHAKKE